MKLTSAILISALATGLCSCVSTSESLASASRSDKSETGRVSLSASLGRIGVLARTQAIVPTKMIVEFRSDLGDVLRDTASLLDHAGDSGTVLGARDWSRSYELASDASWSVSVQVRDGKDSVLYQGTKAFDVSPGRTTSVDMSLDALYSNLRIRIPVIDSATRFVLEIDGKAVAHSCIAGQDRIGDTILMEHDYVAASEFGVEHAVSLRVFGRSWGRDTLLYSGDTSIRAVSGRNSAWTLRLRWVGPDFPPAGAAALSIALGAGGAISFDVSYASRPDVWLYRSFNPVGDHFYTTSLVEWGAMVDSGWNKEWIEGKLWSAATEEGLVPLHRLWNQGLSRHSYSIDPEEIAIMTNGGGWTVQGTAGYVHQEKRDGLSALRRGYNPVTSNHLFTTDSIEFIKALAEGFSDEGIEGWIVAAPRRR